MGMPYTRAAADRMIGRVISAVGFVATVGAISMYGFAASQGRHCFTVNGDWPVTRLFQHAANGVVNLGVWAVDNKKRYCPTGNYFSEASPQRPEAAQTKLAARKTGLDNP